jgi:hypothetical protein
LEDDVGFGLHEGGNQSCSLNWRVIFGSTFIEKLVYFREQDHLDSQNGWIPSPAVIQVNGT